MTWLNPTDLDVRNAMPFPASDALSGLVHFRPGSPEHELIRTRTIHCQRCQFSENEDTKLKFQG